MKRFILSAVLLASAAAFAIEGKTNIKIGNPSDPAQDARESFPKADPKGDLKEAGQNFKEEAGQIGSRTAEKAGAATERQGTFNQPKSYTLRGTVREGGGGEVTIDREGLPSAVLDIRDDTVVTLDGKQIKPRDLPEGVSVRANFQLEGEETVALKIVAKSQGKKMMKKHHEPGTGGAGIQEKPDVEPKMDTEMKTDTESQLRKDYNEADKTLQEKFRD